MKSFINISPGFQYSVNLRYDIDNANKVSGYIPTEKAIGLTSELIDSLQPKSNDRARILIGSYGTGKSHYLAFFGSMLKGQLDDEVYEPVIEKMRSNGINPLRDKIYNELLSRNEKHLVVIINGNGKNIEQSFRQGLKEALENAGLENLVPNTVFDQAKAMIETWKQDYPNTYALLEKHLETNKGWVIKDLIDKLEIYDEKTMDYFIDIYPSLTAGSQFNTFANENITELYEKVNQQLVNEVNDNYCGVYVIFDEFNKFLETMASTGGNENLIMLQDFAEACNRSAETQMHLLLVTHQHISQYISKMPQHVINEWVKIEGRFKSVDFHQHSSKIYSLISKVINKNQKLWMDYKHYNKEAFNYLKEETESHSIFHDLEEWQLSEWVLEGCYPLHPVSTYALPRISNLVAQNERTLFTFLSTNDFNSLGEFIDNRSGAKEKIIEDEKETKLFDLLTLEIVYDYFSDLIKKMPYEERANQVWRQSQKILQKIGFDDAEQLNHHKDIQKIVKTIAIILIIDEDRVMPPTKPFIEFALWNGSNMRSNVDECIHFLFKKKWIYQKNSNGHIRFFEGSSLDIPEEIKRVQALPKYRSSFSKSKILNDHFLPYPIIANRFNDQFEMTRFFIPMYFSVQELENGINWKNETTIHQDGILVYALPESNEEIENMYAYIEQQTHDQVVFVIPKEPINIHNEIMNYQALMILSKDRNFLEQDPQLHVEIDLYLEDLYEEIEAKISILLDPKEHKSSYHYKGKEFNSIATKADLSRKVSEICNEVFRSTPIINNEMINKNSVSKTIANARKKLVNGLFNRIDEEQLGLTGYGPDVSIFRSIIGRNNLQHSLKNHIMGETQWKHDEEFNKCMDGNPRKNLEKVLAKIEDIVLQSANGVSFCEIIEELKKPPFGIRQGIIPILLSIIIVKNGNYIIIKDSKGVEQPLSAEVIEEAVCNSDQYNIQVVSIDLKKEEYLRELETAFRNHRTFAENYSTNKMYPVALAMKNWFISLPKFTRETKELKKEGVNLRKALGKTNKDSKELLFHIIPKFLFGDTQFEEDNWEEYVKRIKKAKKQMDQHLKEKIESLDKVLSTLFCAEKPTHALADIRTWKEDLDKNTRNYLFTGGAGQLFKAIDEYPGYNHVDFIHKLAREMTGLRIEDWSDDLYNDFKDIVISAKEKIDHRDNRKPHQEKAIKMIIPTESGEFEEYSFQKTEIDGLGEILHDTLNQSLEQFADSVSVEEKRQVLVRLLQDLK